MLWCSLRCMPYLAFMLSLLTRQHPRYIKAGQDLCTLLALCGAKRPGMLGQPMPNPGLSLLDRFYCNTMGCMKCAPLRNVAEFAFEPTSTTPTMPV